MIYLKQRSSLDLKELKEIIIILEWLGEDWRVYEDSLRAGMIMDNRFVELKDYLTISRLKKLLSPWIGWAELNDNEVRGKGDNKKKKVTILHSLLNSREMNFDFQKSKGGRDGTRRSRSGIGMVGATFNEILFILSRSILALLNQPENLTITMVSFFGVKQEYPIYINNVEKKTPIVQNLNTIRNDYTK